MYQSPAIRRVRKDGKKDLKVYSEKFLYSQIVKAFKKGDRKKLSRAVKVFLRQYPKSHRADNAIYYKGANWILERVAWPKA